MVMARVMTKEKSTERMMLASVYRLSGVVVPVSSSVIIHSVRQPSKL